MTCPSESRGGGWTAFQAFWVTFVVCRWEERAEPRLFGLFL